MITTIRQQLLDILNIELQTQRTLAQARAAAAEAINRYFKSNPSPAPGKPPELVRIAIQFSARYIPILSHACRANLIPLRATPESTPSTAPATTRQPVTNTPRTYKKRPAKKHR